jgi:diaminopimelate decarboxylase
MFDKSLLQRFNSLPTPFYYYDLDVLSKTISEIKKEASKFNYIVHYALKANANTEILDLINKAGLGADCVSGNEVKKAIETGFKPDHVVFAGVGKSDEEINYALKLDIFSFNCESLQEMEVINELASKQNKIARIALRINPNVDASTHHYITTGLEENKFGINTWELDGVLENLKQHQNLKLIGLHFHIGSQITNLTAFKSLCLRVNQIHEWFDQRRIIIEHLNLGGGLGVDYHEPDQNLIPDFATYFKIFNEFLTVRKDQKVHFEIGRAIVAQCGSLISKVLYIKKGINTNFVILDAGMTELIRPALYQSYHKIENLTQKIDQDNSANTNQKSEIHKYDVVGPICESSDCFGKAINLPESKRGDLFVIRTAGAYGEVMASGYNLREKVKAIYS